MRIHYLGVLLIAGCGGDLDPVPNEYDDIAKLVGATISTVDGGATMGAIRDSTDLAFGTVPDGFRREPGLVSGMHGTLEHRYIMVQCRDTDNRLLVPCDATTNLATMVVSWSGSIDRSDLVMSSSRQGMWSLAYLQTWMPRLTGSSSLQSEGSIDGRAYTWTATEVETMVTPSDLVGGTIHLDISVTQPTDWLIAADVMFDEPMTSATLVLDNDYRYRVDLSNGDTHAVR